jgi:hypothetical protein
MNAWVHTNTKPQISSTRSRGLGWRIHGSVEDTKLSTNKQHSLSLLCTMGKANYSATSSLVSITSETCGTDLLKRINDTISPKSGDATKQANAHLDDRERRVPCR